MFILYIVDRGVDGEGDSKHLLVAQSVDRLSLHVSWAKLDHPVLRQIVLLAWLYLFDQARDPGLHESHRLGADLREGEESDLEVETLRDGRWVSICRRLEGDEVEGNSGGS